MIAFIPITCVNILMLLSVFLIDANLARAIKPRTIYDDLKWAFATIIMSSFLIRLPNFGFSNLLAMGIALTPLLVFMVLIAVAIYSFLRRKFDWN